MSEFVFGYGSLAELGPGVSRTSGPELGWVTDLVGWRRRWSVAMDNDVDIAGYKHYRSADGSRPSVCVAFLDVWPDRAVTVNGVCLPVDDGRLAQFDRRERNYDRVDVTTHLTRAEGRTWTYVGRADARDRAERARREARLVVSRAYRDGVLRAFDALPPGERDAFDRSTDTLDVPLLDLRRVQT